MKNHQLINSIAIKPDIIIIDPKANPNIKLPSPSFMRKNRGPAIAVINQKLEDLLDENADYFLAAFEKKLQ